MTNFCVGSLWGECLFLLLDRRRRIYALYGSRGFNSQGLNIFDGLELILATDRMGVEKSPPHLPCQGVEERTF